MDRASYLARGGGWVDDDGNDEDVDAGDAGAYAEDASADGGGVNVRGHQVFAPSLPVLRSLGLIL